MTSRGRHNVTGTWVSSLVREGRNLLLVTAVLNPRTGLLRALRGSALAVTSSLLAGTAHVAAGGAAPDGALTVVLTVAVAAAGTALADRRRGPVALLTAVGGTQVVLHLLLDGLGSHAHGAGTAPTTAMTAAHALAAVVTALLLAGAESAVFAVAGAWRRIVAALPLRGGSSITPIARAVLAVAPCAEPAPLRVLMATLLGRRGPPVLS